MVPAAMAKRRQTGVRRVHSPACPARKDRQARCRCKSGWEASAYDLAGRKVRRTFSTFDEAVAWRADSLSARRRGRFRAPGPTTVREAGEALVEGMRDGSVRTRSGDRYKPSTIRGYDDALRVHVFPDLGGLRLAAVTRRQVQALADGLLADGLDPSTIRNALMPLRVLFRRAVEDGEIAASPCTNLRLPAVRGRRDRIVAPGEAAALIDALKSRRDRAAWGLAFYAGLRRGEILGLIWDALDLAGGVVDVRASLDVRTGATVAPKSAAGIRRVPIAAALRDLLLDYRLEVGEVEPERRVFRFDVGSFAARALREWTAANERRRMRREPELQPVELHEARHTAASLWIAAGVDAKALQTYMGHSSITTTYDRYGHLMPGSEREHAAMLDAYLERANTRARLAALEDA